MYAGSLSDTSAFVTLLAGREVHTSTASLRYLDMLDLSSGEELLHRCFSVWPHLDQLVKNRKECILKETLECISGGTRQVVILGSGIDPLSLEIVSRVGDVAVYELDTNLDDKRNLLIEAAPEVADRVACVDADLAQAAEAVAKTAAAGWRSDIPSVVVLEGISYYLREPAMWDIIRQFCTGAENDIILEYMVPAGYIAREWVHIPDDVFGTLQEYMSSPLEVSRLDPARIQERVAETGGRILRRHTMHSIEKNRTGTNLHFPTERSGWIEVCHIRLPPSRPRCPRAASDLGSNGNPAKRGCPTRVGGT